MIKGLPKWERYLLGLEPYNLELLQDVVRAAVAKVVADPWTWDRCICLNYEDPLCWLWWKSELEQDHEDALAMFARVMGRALAVGDLGDVVKVGSWGALICTRAGLRPPPWCLAASRLGECLHLSGYMMNEPEPEWDWLHAQIKAGLEADFEPEDIRVWVAPYGLVDRVQFGTSQLVEMGRILGGYGVGCVFYDDRPWKDFGGVWGEPLPPAVQKQWDRLVLHSTSALIRGMNEGGKEQTDE